jgi:hypothetical protein
MSDQHKITLAMLDDHAKLERVLQSRLLLQYDDELSSLKGIPRLMAISRYATVFGRLWQLFTKQAIFAKEIVMNSGEEIIVNEDVPIEAMSAIMSVPISPIRDTDLENLRVAALKKDDIVPATAAPAQVATAAPAATAPTFE